VYEEVSDMNKLKEKLDECLFAFNNKPRQAKMDIVLFEQAIIMVTKVHRVLSLSRGHVVLAGLPSVGRKSVTKLAAFVEEMNIERLEITKNFGLHLFRTKMK
jgi:dynein heavy chain